MTDLVRAEALKFRTTRAWIGFLAAMLALTVAATAGTVGTAEEVTLGTRDLSREILSAALIVEVVAFVIGIVSVTTEWRHGTLTRTLLGTPRRGRVLVAKELFVVLLALTLALLGIIVVLAVAVPWLALEGSSFDTRVDHAGYAVRIVVATVLWGALGVAVGSVVRSQTPALVGAILWILLIEALVIALLGLVDLEAAGDYLPARALNAFEGSEGDGLSMWPAGAVGVGWVATLALLGHLRIAREDVT